MVISLKGKRNDRSGREPQLQQSSSPHAWRNMRKLCCIVQIVVVDSERHLQYFCKAKLPSYVRDGCRQASMERTKDHQLGIWITWLASQIYCSVAIVILYKVWIFWILSEPFSRVTTYWIFDMKANILAHISLSDHGNGGCPQYLYP